MISFFVFLALAIPIAIHLISRSQGKVVPFPFLRLLPKQKASVELKVTLRQKRLLVVRLLLVFCACLLVSLIALTDWWSQSSLRKTFSPSVSPPTIIVTQDWWATSTEQDKQSLSAQLNSEGFSQVQTVLFVAKNADKRIVRVSKESVANHNLSEILTSELGAVTSSNLVIGNKLNLKEDQRSDVGNVWATALAVSMSIPTDSELHVYTSDRYSQFMGNTVTVRQPVQWHISSASNALNGVGVLPVPTLKLAVITLTGVEALKINHVELAVESLKLVYPNIELAVIRNENVDSLLSTSKQYDYLLVDSLAGHQDSSARNIVDLSQLSVSDSGFVFELGKAVFSELEQEQIFLTAVLTRAQIENAKVTTMIQKVTALPNTEEHRWEKWLIMLLGFLFVLERMMSEPQRKIASSESLDTQGQ